MTADTSPRTSQVPSAHATPPETSTNDAVKKDEPKEEERKDEQQVQSGTGAVAEVEEEWPSLTDEIAAGQVAKEKRVASVVAQAKTPVAPRSKLFRNSSKVKPKTVEPIAASMAQEQKPKFAWGVNAVTQQAESSTSVSSGSAAAAASAPDTAKPTCSLLDVINEELKNVSLSKAATNNKQSSPSSAASAVTSSASESKTKSAAAAAVWNVASARQTASHSIAQIMQMEERRRECRASLNKRPLHLIQAEEKAIEDLKRFYQSQANENMTISVELVENIYNDTLDNWNI